MLNSLLKQSIKKIQQETEYFGTLLDCIYCYWKIQFCSVFFCYVQYNPIRALFWTLCAYENWSLLWSSSCWIVPGIRRKHASIHGSLPSSQSQLLLLISLQLLLNSLFRTFVALLCNYSLIVLAQSSTPTFPECWECGGRGGWDSDWGSVGANLFSPRGLAFLWLSSSGWGCGSLAWMLFTEGQEMLFSWVVMSVWWVFSNAAFAVDLI